MMISELLKTETAENHKRLEALLFVEQIFNKSLSLLQYKKLLAINFAVHKLLEADIYEALLTTIGNTIIQTSHPKLPALQKDMDEINNDILLKKNIAVPTINDTAEALGALYVLEGATLGGRVIYKQLQQTPGLQHLHLHYYNFYKDLPGQRWKNFLDIMNRQVPPQQYAQCVAKANETFLFFENVAIAIL